MVDIDGTSGFKGDSMTDVIDQVVVWHGTALPVGAANKVPQNGLFLKVDSLSAPTTQTLYIQTSATLSSPSFVIIPSGGGLPYLKLSTTIADYSSPASNTVTSGTKPSVASYSGTWSTPPADLDNTIDADLGTRSNQAGHIGAGQDQAITVDMGTERTEAITVKYQHKLNGAGGDNCSYFIESSTDGSAWTTRDTFVLTTFDNWVDKTVNIGSITYRYMRIRMNTNNTARFRGLAVYELVSQPILNWTSNSEASPAIYEDFTSVREFVSVALTINKTLTTVTAIKIRASTDTTFTDAENIAYINIDDFTDDVTRFIPFNFLEDDRRYIQVIGVGTGVLSMRQFYARYGITDLIKILTHKNKTRNVNSADSFDDSN